VRLNDRWPSSLIGSPFHRLQAHLAYILPVVRVCDKTVAEIVSYRSKGLLEHRLRFVHVPERKRRRLGASGKDSRSLERMLGFLVECTVEWRPEGVAHKSRLFEVQCTRRGIECLRARITPLPRAQTAHHCLDRRHGL
jgi:hypothetical protein